MQSEYDVLHKQDSYTSHVWFLGWLGLAMGVQGSMPKVQLVYQQRPCHVVQPLSFWKINSFPPNSLHLFNV